MPANIIKMLNEDLNSIKELLDNFSQHLRALDRRRLNGVGVRKLGFIERAYEFALENAEFLPHYLTLERFGTDIQYFMDFRTLVDLVTQIREKLWNITIQSSDIAYTDALEFYASVREAPRVAANKSIMQMANMPSAKKILYAEWTPPKRSITHYRRSSVAVMVKQKRKPKNKNCETSKVYCTASMTANW
jgi:hypothetical protein